MVLVSKLRRILDKFMLCAAVKKITRQWWSFHYGRLPVREVLKSVGHHDDALLAQHSLSEGLLVHLFGPRFPEGGKIAILLFLAHACVQVSEAIFHA